MESSDWCLALSTFVISAGNSNLKVENHHSMVSHRTYLVVAAYLVLISKRFEFKIITLELINY